MFFTPGHKELLQTARIGLVVPQQSLRESISRVFQLTPGLNKRQVLSPFEIGNSAELFDLLIVDEAHRLNHRANQASGTQNTKFGEINQRLFDKDDHSLTQIDWIRKQSKHVILMLDTGQTVRPADLPEAVTRDLLAEASNSGRVYPLRSQMRVSADKDYVGYARRALSNNPPKPEHFGQYDLQFFEDAKEMRQAILRRNAESGLSRLVAGYAWKWISKNDKSAFDIELDGTQLRWNSTQRDWIGTEGSENEVGSIHTVQGYDLNYVGVIIGPDIFFDTESQQIRFSRDNYFDTKGKEDNKKRGIKYSDEDILEYVRNIYVVLLTRGILGTYVYVCDPALRNHLRPLFTAPSPSGERCDA